MDYRLIAATPDDEAWLEALRRGVYRELFDATWGGWDEARHQRHFAGCMARGHISIIELDGVRVGMVQVFDGPDTDAVDVGEIQVQPSAQNRGIGTAVLNGLIAQAREGGKPVRLRLGLKNEGAYRLYERLGFRLVERTETHHHMIREP